ncbi:cellulose synthase, partial [Enterococcus faecalis]
RYLANYELMTQTDKEETTVDENTDTFSSTLEFDGNYPLTSTGDKLEGAYLQELTYFVNLPVERNNANGSRVHLHFKYAENLVFDSSLVTVYA